MADIQRFIDISDIESIKVSGAHLKNPFLMLLVQTAKENSRSAIRSNLKRLMVIFLSDSKVKSVPMPDGTHWEVYRDGEMNIPDGFEYYFPFQLITPPLMRQAIATMRQAGYKNASINATLSHWKSYIQTAFEMDMVDVDTYTRAQVIKQLKTKNDQESGFALTNQQVNIIFGTINMMNRREDMKLRDRIIIGLMLLAGLRREEVANLRNSHVDMETRTIFIERGKGDKNRHVPINTQLHALLEKWFAIHNHLKGPVVCKFSKHKKIISHKGVTAQAIYKRVMEIKKAIPKYIAQRREQDADYKGREFGFSPHDLRHTYITNALDESPQESHVQHIAGHASFSTTQRYDHRDKEKILAVGRTIGNVEGLEYE